MHKLTNFNAHESIFLYGPSGSGKSTIGQQLAQNLNLPFVDLDQEIESRSGKQIPDIFNSEGERGFRAYEQRALREAAGNNAAIVALGGGALTIPENRAWVENHGTVILLTAPFDTLLSRLQADPVKRPLIASSISEDESNSIRENLRAYLSRREEHYASFSRKIHTGELSPEEIAWKIQVLVGAFHLRAMAGPKHPGYDVRVMPGGLNQIGWMIRARGLKGPVVIVTDEHVAEHYLPTVEGSLSAAGYRTQAITLPPGEIHKNLAAVSQLWDGFLSARIERSSTVIALGGGVVGDLAGFAAATFMRGVPWAVAPTSLLAMIDASMGGKTGADLPQGKNLIGAFHPPRLVLADPETLKTLPKTEFFNGMAEALKHGIIADPELFERCLEFGEPHDIKIVDEIVRHGMAVKVRFIEEDPYEKGIRAALNYGHTIGHGVELASNFQIRHGEAVAIGMAAEARLAENIGLAEHGLSDQITCALKRLKLPTRVPVGLDRDRVISAMQRDKKIAGGVVRFALPPAIGEVRIGVEVEDWVEKIWRL
jgi:3-dehydroquinate synthase